MKSLFPICLFLGSVGIIAYAYALYPLLIVLLARVFPRPGRVSISNATCTLVICAHNEGRRLRNKIEALRGLADFARVEKIVVGLDGCSDDTADHLAGLKEPKLVVRSFAHRRGKPSVINDLKPDLTSELVVFTDARQLLGEGAISALLDNLADPQVGIVSGELVFTADGQPTATSSSMQRYWSYEKCIRRNEGAFRSVPGVTGALYAIRRALIPTLPASTILDDLYTPMAVIRAGYRCVFEPRALAFDRPSTELRREQLRKRRTLAGVLQIVRLQPWTLLPFINPIWWEFVSHKLLRLAVPFALLGLPASCALGWDNPLMRTLLLAQGAGLMAAVFGALIPRKGFWSLPWMFLLMNGTVLLAWWDALRGVYKPMWDKTG